MTAIPVRRRIRWAKVFGYITLLVLALVLLVIGLPGDREVLVFDGEVVSPTDECRIIGGPGGDRSGSCSDMAEKEVRYSPANNFLLLLSAGNAALLVWAATRELLGGRRYTVDDDLDSDIPELGQFAELSAMGHRHDTFTLSRGFLVRSTGAVLGHFENGLVICGNDQRPRVYPWARITDVRREGKNEDGKISFEFDLAFDDATILRTECSYRPGGASAGDSRTEPRLRFVVFMDTVSRKVAELRGGG